MLRASCEAKEIDINPGAVVDPELPCGVDHYQELINFADTLVGAQTVSKLDSTSEKGMTSLNAARLELEAVVGNEGVTRAAAVIANFQMMNRALDTLGAQLGKELTPEILSLASELAMTAPEHWT